MTRYLAAFTVDAFGTTALAIVALPTGAPELLLLAAVAAIGVLLAALAFGAYEEAGRSGAAVGLLVAGFAVTTAGCAAVLFGPVGHVHPLALPAALLLLVIGDVLSLVYLRQVARAAPYAP